MPEKSINMFQLNLHYEHARTAPRGVAGNMLHNRSAFYSPEDIMRSVLRLKHIHTHMKLANLFIMLC